MEPCTHGALGVSVKWTLQTLLLAWLLDPVNSMLCHHSETLALGCGIKQRAKGLCLTGLGLRLLLPTGDHSCVCALVGEQELKGRYGECECWTLAVLGELAYSITGSNFGFILFFASWSLNGHLLLYLTLGNYLGDLLIINCSIEAFPGTSFTACF